MEVTPPDTVDMGNIDPAEQFTNGTPETMRAATLELMEKCCRYPFGPGYYGMPHSDIKKLAKIIPMDRIGVQLRESGIMVPLKTIAAIYLITDDPQVLPPLACSECFGRLEGCRMCSNNTLDFFRLNTLTATEEQIV